MSLVLSPVGHHFLRFFIYFFISFFAPLFNHFSYLCALSTSKLVNSRPFFLDIWRLYFSFQHSLYNFPLPAGWRELPGASSSTICATLSWEGYRRGYLEQPLRGKKSLYDKLGEIHKTKLFFLILFFPQTPSGAEIWGWQRVSRLVPVGSESQLAWCGAVTTSPSSPHNLSVSHGLLLRCSSARAGVHPFLVTSSECFFSDGQTILLTLKPASCFFLCSLSRTVILCWTCHVPAASSAFRWGLQAHW